MAPSSASPSSCEHWCTTRVGGAPHACTIAMRGVGAHARPRTHNGVHDDAFDIEQGTVNMQCRRQSVTRTAPPPGRTQSRHDRKDRRVKQSAIVTSPLHAAKHADSCSLHTARSPSTLPGPKCHRGSAHKRQVERSHQHARTPRSHRKQSRHTALQGPRRVRQAGQQRRGYRTTAMR